MSDDDLSTAEGAMRAAGELASGVVGRYRPPCESVPARDALDLAGAARNATFYLGLLIAEVRRLRPYEKMWNELGDATEPTAGGSR